MHDKFTDIMLDICPKYRTKEDILHDLAFNYDYPISERQLRKMFENYNKEYQAHLTNGYYIAHGQNGYKITKDTEDIKKSLRDNHKRAITMLARESKIRRAMGEDLLSQEIAQELDEQIKRLDTANI